MVQLLRFQEGTHVGFVAVQTLEEPNDNMTKFDTVPHKQREELTSNFSDGITNKRLVTSSPSGACDREG